MRAIPISLLLLASAAPAWAQSPPRPGTQQVDPTHAITVTGIRIQTYRDRLAECLARHCPVNEDVDATLALAEALFLGGDYAEGRRTVRASIGRNRDQAANFPEPVSDLYRAHARLNRHLGYDDQALRSTNQILRSLQAGLPQEDYRHFTARLEIADLHMEMGNAQLARRQLAELIRAADAAGRQDVVTMARLRTIWFDYIADPYGNAKSRLTEMAAITDPARRMESVGAKLLLARIYRAEGDARRADVLLAEVGRGSSTRRRLISSPTYHLQMQERTALSEVGATPDLAEVIRFANTINRIPDDFRNKWIDVGFWIDPDGHVSGLEIQRSGGETQWADPLMESIRGRIYSTGPEPTYRLERYTYTSGIGRETETRIAQHSPRARVEYMDLTANAPPEEPPAPGGAAQPGGAMH